MEREIAVLQGPGFFMKTGIYLEMPKGTVFNIAIGVLWNNEIPKNDVLTSPYGATFGDGTE